MATKRGQHYSFPKAKEKMGFEYEQQAWKFIESHMMEDMTVYICRKCKRYHIGHELQDAAR
jgi:hypothetical protein